MMMLIVRSKLLKALLFCCLLCGVSPEVLEVAEKTDDQKNQAFGYELTVLSPRKEDEDVVKLQTPVGDASEQGAGPPRGMLAALFGYPDETGNSETRPFPVVPRKVAKYADHASVSGSGMTALKSSDATHLRMAASPSTWQKAVSTAAPKMSGFKSIKEKMMAAIAKVSDGNLTNPSVSPSVEANAADTEQMQTLDSNSTNVDLGDAMNGTQAESGNFTVQSRTSGNKREAKEPFPGTREQRQLMGSGPSGNQASFRGIQGQHLPAGYIIWHPIPASFHRGNRAKLSPADPPAAMEPSEKSQMVLNNQRGEPPPNFIPHRPFFVEPFSNHHGSGDATLRGNGFPITHFSSPPLFAVFPNTGPSKANENESNENGPRGRHKKPKKPKNRPGKGRPTSEEQGEPLREFGPPGGGGGEGMLPVHLMLPPLPPNGFPNSPVMAGPQPDIDFRNPGIEGEAGPVQRFPGPPPPQFGPGSHQGLRGQNNLQPLNDQFRQPSLQFNQHLPLQANNFQPPEVFNGQHGNNEQHRPDDQRQHPPTNRPRQPKPTPSPGPHPAKFEIEQQKHQEEAEEEEEANRQQGPKEFPPGGAFMPPAPFPIRPPPHQPFLPPPDHLGQRQPFAPPPPPPQFHSNSPPAQFLDAHSDSAFHHMQQSMSRRPPVMAEASPSASASHHPNSRFPFPSEMPPSGQFAFPGRPFDHAPNAPPEEDSKEPLMYTRDFKKIMGGALRSAKSTTARPSVGSNDFSPAPRLPKPLASAEPTSIPLRQLPPFRNHGPPQTGFSHFPNRFPAVASFDSSQFAQINSASFQDPLLPTTGQPPRQMQNLPGMHPNLPDFNPGGSSTSTAQPQLPEADNSFSSSARGSLAQLGGDETYPSPGFHTGHKGFPSSVTSPPVSQADSLSEAPLVRARSGRPTSKSNFLHFSSTPIPKANAVAHHESQTENDSADTFDHEDAASTNPSSSFYYEVRYQSPVPSKPSSSDRSTTAGQSNARSLESPAHATAAATGDISVPAASSNVYKPGTSRILLEMGQWNSENAKSVAGASAG